MSEDPNGTSAGLAALGSMAKAHASREGVGRSWEAKNLDRQVITFTSLTCVRFFEQSAKSIDITFAR